MCLGAFKFENRCRNNKLCHCLIRFDMEPQRALWGRKTMFLFKHFLVSYKVSHLHHFPDISLMFSTVFQFKATKLSLLAKKQQFANKII